MGEGPIINKALGHSRDARAADIEPKKQCSKCGVEKPVSEFYAVKRGRFGRRPDCKSCHNAYHNAWARRRYVPAAIARAQEAA
jgi:hypothetical protein